MHDMGIGHSRNLERFEAILKKLKRKVTDDDVARLTEIKIKRISKYDSFKADELIKGIEDQIKEVKKNIFLRSQDTPLGTSKSSKKNLEKEEKERPKFRVSAK